VVEEGCLSDTACSHYGSNALESVVPKVVELAHFLLATNQKGVLEVTEIRFYR